MIATSLASSLTSLDGDFAILTDESFIVMTVDIALSLDLQQVRKFYFQAKRRSVW